MTNLVDKFHVKIVLLTPLPCLLRLCVPFPYFKYVLPVHAKYERDYASFTLLQEPKPKLCSSYDSLPCRKRKN